MRSTTLFIMIAIITVFAACKGKREEAEKATTPSAGSMASISSGSVRDVKTVGILLYDGYAVLDAMGPYHVLSEMMGTNVFFVGRNKGLITTANGLKIQCDTSIAEVKQLDILLIPGGLTTTYQATKDTALLNWIKAIDEHSKYTTSVCTGAWILGATGLLKDKEATTHWYGKKLLASEYGAKVEDKRFVKSGKYWTSAGVSAGIDMSLELIREIKGEKYAKAAMLDLEYAPQPPFKGGTEQNTDKAIVDGVRAMYDSGMEAVLHPKSAFKTMQFGSNKDLICGMPLTGGVADTARYNGKVYGFCSTGCKDEFSKDPSAYVSK